MDAELTALSGLALSIADEAAALLTAALARPRSAIETKSSPTDMVTATDRAAEELIAGRIREARPNDGILGEEGASTEGSSGYRWVVDPIDGTTNFVYGYPGFAVSIAVERDGEAVVGVVTDVSQGEVFSAIRGGGATRNGEEVHVSDATETSTALVATGFAFEPRVRARQGAAIAGLLPQIRDIRRIGAASVDLCSVACGRVDGFFERGLNRWDYAAGALIVTEAGGRVGAIEGGAAVPGSIIATAPGVFDGLGRLVRAAEDAPGAPSSGLA